MNEELIKYYVWKNNDRIIGFYDFEDALEYAKEFDCDEIEKTIWASEEDYQNYEPAIDFELVWTNDRKEN